jgi:hypothetical protein
MKNNDKAQKPTKSQKRGLEGVHTKTDRPPYVVDCPQPQGVPLGLEHNKHV